jgi:hypothetical protein
VTVPGQGTESSPNLLTQEALSMAQAEAGFSCQGSHANSTLPIAFAHGSDGVVANLGIGPHIPYGITPLRSHVDQIGSVRSEPEMPTASLRVQRRTSQVWQTSMPSGIGPAASCHATTWTRTSRPLMLIDP